MGCRYATAGSDATLLLVSAAIVPRITSFAVYYLLPAFTRATTQSFSQEQHHDLLLNGDFPLGYIFAEVGLIMMHTFTFGAGVPIMYPVAALALLLIVFDTKVKLKYMWPIPRRHDVLCTKVFLAVVKGMAYVHVAFAAWMFSYFRMYGQVTGARPCS